MLVLPQKVLQLIECSEPGDITACVSPFTCFPSLSWPLLEAGCGTQCSSVEPTIVAMCLCLLSLCHSLETLCFCWGVQSSCKCWGKREDIRSQQNAFSCFSHSNSSLKDWLLIRPPLVGVAQFWILIFEVVNFHFVCVTRSSVWTWPVPGTFQN